MKKITVCLVVAMVLAVGSLTQTEAGLMGQEITAQWLYPTMSDVIETHDFFVGPGLELPHEVIQRDSKFDIDVGDDYILFTFLSGSQWQNTTANGWQFIDKNGTIEEIVGFEVGMTTGSITGVDPEDLVFTADSIFANFGLSGPNGRVVYGQGSTIRLDIAFVPEPGTMFLVGLGGMVVRKKY